MKNLPAHVTAGGNYQRAGAVQFDFDGGPFRYWGCGQGELTLAGIGVFTGLEAKALIAPISAAMGSAAPGAELRLSGLEPALATALSGATQRGRAAKIWRVYFADDLVTLLGYNLFLAGAVGPVVEREQVGGTVDLIIPIEGGAFELGRSSSRMRSSADQATLGGPLDRSMKSIAFAGEKQLYWGALPPGNVSAVVPNTGGLNLNPLQQLLLF